MWRSGVIKLARQSGGGSVASQELFRVGAGDATAVAFRAKDFVGVGFSGQVHHARRQL